ncbi:hypothetical protein C8R47DRAFT_1189607 [Mycena vitilis]|nr:hypothetical protein C8R47DRAFT_1189607 [Mycena vitilis]
MDVEDDASRCGGSGETTLTAMTTVADCDHLMEDAALATGEVKSEPPSEEEEIAYACQLVPELLLFFEGITGRRNDLTSVYTLLKKWEEHPEWHIAEARYISGEGWRRLYEDPRVCASLAWRNSEYTEDEDSLGRAYVSSRQDWREPFRIKWKRRERNFEG